ncbi:MAG: CHAD domain-containing protein [Sphingobacteriia bacterium]|nr:CHAD domain-containing protein [Sphingobacteriia bacterium]NCC39603.1 CHAD domain-containing protein [Gammaproteobacteria bacterium]
MKNLPPIHSRQSVNDAFVAILRHNFADVGTWQDVARTWDDIEGVHQVRVAFRRMRSALSVFREAIPRELTTEMADEMRWIAGELGPARDLDVFIAEGLGAVASMLPLEGETTLRGLAETRRAQVYAQQVRVMLDSERYQKFCGSFPRWLDERPWEQSLMSKKRAKRLYSNIIPFARKQLDKQNGRVLAAGAHINREDVVAMHQLRIECKKLRYAAEFFRPLFEGMGDFITHLKGIQDLLGTMNDVSVTQRLLDDLLADSSDHQVLIYAGGLIGWRTCEYCHLLNRFDEYWDELAGARHEWWKKNAVIKV